MIHREKKQNENICILTSKCHFLLYTNADYLGYVYSFLTLKHSVL